MAYLLGMSAYGGRIRVIMVCNYLNSQVIEPLKLTRFGWFYIEII